VAELATAFGPEDLRAAVAAGVLTEAQAASVAALAHDRAGKRAAMPAEDEPFEFFRGFSEIFVSVGLMILLAGIATTLAIFGGFAVLVVLPLVTAAIAWWWAGYFTLKRRMNLPSMVLASAFGGGLFLAVFTMLGHSDGVLRFSVVTSFVIAAIGMGLWYRRFRLPFAMFILGLFALGAIYTLTASVDSLGGFVAGDRWGIDGLFDLRESPAFALATLGFGIAAFVAAMWFDLQDRYRLGRYAATAFWLHLLAAPALVNTVALTLYNVGGGTGIAALSVALALIAALALVIDRRSFLTAAIGYIAILIAWIVRGEDGDFSSWTFVLILLGAVITALGTWWVPLRAAVMRALPDFPGKTRLPPYAETA
jgi:hypothetical protein